MVELDASPTRTISWMRTLRMTVRSAHVIAAAAYFGGHVYGVPPEQIVPAFVAVLGTGVAFVVLEVARAPVWMVQVRGVAALLKVGLMLWAQAWTPLAIPLLTVALVVGVVVSHMPGRYRYYSLAHRRVVGHQDKG